MSNIQNLEIEGVEFTDDDALSIEEKAARALEMDCFEKDYRDGDPFEAVNALIRSRQSRYPAEQADKIRDDILRIFAFGGARYITRQVELASDIYNAATSAENFADMYSKVAALSKNGSVDTLALLGLIALGGNAKASTVREAIDKHVSERAKASANKGHAANRAMRDEAYQWLDKHFLKDKLSNDKAAEQLGKIVPQEFSTRLSYVKKWKRSR